LNIDRLYINKSRWIKEIGKQNRKNYNDAHKQESFLTKEEGSKLLKVSSSLSHYIFLFETLRRIQGFKVFDFLQK